MWYLILLLLLVSTICAALHLFIKNYNLVEKNKDLDNDLEYLTTNHSTLYHDWIAVTVALEETAAELDGTEKSLTTAYRKNLRLHGTVHRHEQQLVKVTQQRDDALVVLEMAVSMDLENNLGPKSVGAEVSMAHGVHYLFRYEDSKKIEVARDGQHYFFKNDRELKRHTPAITESVTAS